MAFLGFFLNRIGKFHGYFQGHPRTRGWKQNSGVAFCIAKAEGFCATKNRESMVIEPIWQGEGYDWGVFLDHFHEGEEILVTSTLHSRLRGRLWKEFGRMVLGWYQDHPVQLFSYVAKLQTQFQRIDEPNAQKNS